MKKFLFLLFFYVSSCVSINHAPLSDNSNYSQWLNSGLLMSERIEKKFGSYGVEILFQNEQQGIRLANLYSKENEHKVTRIIALTKYENSIPDKLIEAHNEILKGGSIGSTLTKHGFLVSKQIFFKQDVNNLPSYVNNLMKNNSNSYSVVMYQLVAKNQEESLPYCTITEIYSPYFLTMKDLDIIYSDNLSIQNCDAVIEKNISILNQISL